MDVVKKNEEGNTSYLNEVVTYSEYVTLTLKSRIRNAQIREELEL